MKVRRLVAVVALGVILASCGGAGFSRVKVNIDMREANKLYRMFREIGFCMEEDGECYGVVEGGLGSVPMPKCEVEDYVVHTHPIWAEKWANYLDIMAWEEYHKRYGNEVFGVMVWKDRIKFYKIDPVN